jgi:hypothetical protein
MLKNKIVALATVSTVFFTALAGTDAIKGNVTEVKCDKDSSFMSESCDQCFMGDSVKT